MNSHSRRFRISFLLVALAAGGLAYHQDLVGRVAYAVEKGKLAAGQDQLSKVEDISALFRQVAKQVRPAVVYIRTTSTPNKETRKDSSKGSGSRRTPDPNDPREYFRRFFEEYGDGRMPEMPDMPSAPSQASGSGVIIDAEHGYVLTNNHVVSEGENARTRIDVLLSDGRHTKGTVLGTDPKTDMALVQIKADRLHAAPLGDSSQMEVGDWVVAVGAPFGLEQTVTQGIISATGRTNPDIAKVGDFLQTDAAINPGNSGGPLVNMHGQVIGINTAIATNGMSGGYMGVGFAIPSNTARDIIPYLEKGEEVVRGYLGVQIRGLDTFEEGMGKSLGLKDETGVLVEDVMPDTPAAKAGLKMDDVILSFDGKRVKTAAELQNLVSHIKPDSKVDTLVWRDGKEVTVPIKIEKQPQNFYDRGALGRKGGRGQDKEDQAEEKTEEATLDAVGLTVEPLSETTAKRYGWTDETDMEGKLVVTQVEPLGEAKQLNISAGDLIISVQGVPVRSVSALKKALSKEALAKGVRIKVKSPREGFRTSFLQINP